MRWRLVDELDGLGGAGVGTKGEPMSHERFHSAIEACAACAEACETGALAGLAGGAAGAFPADLVRLCRDCAAACWGTAAFCSRDSRFAEDYCLLCAEVCDACTVECRKHAELFSQDCVAACERCAEECRRTAGVVVP